MQSAGNNSKRQQGRSDAAGGPGGLSHRRRTDGPPGDSGRVRPFLVLSLGTAGWAVVVLLLARVCRASADRVTAPGPARPEDAVALLAAVAGLATGVWLALATTLTAVAAIGRTSRAGRAAVPVCFRLAPAGLRRVVLVAVGIGLTAAAPATAAPPSARPAAVAGTARSATGLDPGWAPASGSDPRPVPEVAGRVRGPAEDAVVVRPGDCLWRIAARRLEPGAAPARIAAEWPRWYAENRATIGPDPDALLPGQRLRRPGPATGVADRSSTGSAGSTGSADSTDSTDSTGALGTPGERS